DGQTEWILLGFDDMLLQVYPNEILRCRCHRPILNDLVSAPDLQGLYDARPHPTCRLAHGSSRSSVPLPWASGKPGSRGWACSTSSSSLFSSARARPPAWSCRSSLSATSPPSAPFISTHAGTTCAACCRRHASVSCWPHGSCGISTRGCTG